MCVLDRRLVLLTGKGGVGKSTLTAGLAVAAEARGGRPLIVEVGGRGAMGSIFGRASRHAPAPVSEGAALWGVDIDLEEALCDFVVEQVKIRRVARAIVDHPALRGLLRAAPAVREVVTLARIAALVAAVERGRPRWSPVLVDLDATGHALMMLEMPRVIAALVGGGPLARVGHDFEALLGDPTRTSLLLVGLAAEVPAEETLELHRAVTSRTSVRVGGVLLNQVPAPLPIADDAALALAEERARLTDAGPILDDVDLARRRLRAREVALAVAERVRGAMPGVPVALVPRVDGGAGRGDLRGLGEGIVRDLGGHVG